MKILTGHTSKETAYVIEDYPHGFTARCQKRMWVETKKGHGQRVVSQTTNPRTGVWQAEKKGVYHSVAILTLNEDNNHVEVHAFSGDYNSQEFFNLIGTEGFKLLDKYQADILAYCLSNRKAKDTVKPPFLKSEWDGLTEDRKKEIKNHLSEVFQREMSYYKSLRNEVVV